MILQFLLKNNRPLILITYAVILSIQFKVSAQITTTGSDVKKVLLVKRCNDFAITSAGSDPAWASVAWNKLTLLDSTQQPYATRFKLLYSGTGIYVLFEGADKKITTSDYKDSDNIFNGDVFEVFFHPDKAVRVYYEYEVNALGRELILAIASKPGLGYNSWIPRRSGVKKMVKVNGGTQEIGGSIDSWTAEIFFPYSGMGLLPKVPPVSGDQWNANFCRLDYDSGKMIKWSWTPSIKTSFHELEAFHAIKFE